MVISTSHTFNGNSYYSSPQILRINSLEGTVPDSKETTVNRVDNVCAVMELIFLLLGDR